MDLPSSLEQLHMIVQHNARLPENIYLRRCALRAGLYASRRGQTIWPTYIDFE